MQNRFPAVLALALFVLLVVRVGAASGALKAAHPNIILVVADDMSWSDTGYSGSAKAKSPNLDDMAAKGVEFDYFYPASQQTATARFAILSGRDPLRTGLFSIGSARPEEILLPHALKQAGYKSAHFGKGNLGEGGAYAVPGDMSLIGMGFDPAIWHYNTGGLDIKFQVNDTNAVVETKGDGSLATMDLALDYIRKQAKAPEPFFVQICFVAPHTVEFGKLVPEFQGFGGQVTAMDAAIGNQRTELRKLGIADNTIVWFISDNASLQGKDRMTIASRIPALLEWHAHIKKPIKTDMVAGQVDIYPTLLEISGVKVAKQPVLDGISLVPLLDGKATERRKPLGFMFWKPGNGIKLKSRNERNGALADANFIMDPQGAWIDGKYKLIVGHGPVYNNGPGPFLYDFYADPNLKTNLADKDPQRVQNMTRALDEWRASVRASFDGKDPGAYTAK